MVKRADTIAAAADDLGVLLQFVRSHSVDTMTQKAWLDLKLTMPQTKVLFAIVRARRMRSADVADALGVGRSAVTPLVEKLVQLKLVRRAPDPDDRRVVWLTPTPRAEELHERLIGSGRANLQALLDTLSADALAAAAAGLAALAAAVKARQP